MRGHFLRTAHDADALKYSLNVQTADAQPLEADVHWAKNQFVLYTKADGNWNAIKASCILAGARTLAGALVPLAGTAPTRFGTEAGWNYNRKTGTAGNGTNNYLDSNRNNNADPQNSCHISVYGTSFGATTSTIKVPLGRQINGFNEKVLFASTAINSGLLSCRGQSTNAIVAHTGNRVNGLIGWTRSSSTTVDIHNNGSTVSRLQTSTAPSASTLFVFASSNGISPNDGGTATYFDDSRIAFYSIGESLNLALLNTRFSTLINAFAAAIP